MKEYRLMHLKNLVLSASSAPLLLACQCFAESGILYGISGNSLPPGTEPTFATLYSFDLSAGTTNVIDTVDFGPITHNYEPIRGVGNSLAYNPVNDVLYFSQANSRALYSYNLGTGVQAGLGNFEDLFGGLPTATDVGLGSTTSVWEGEAGFYLNGGGAWYEGSYYFTGEHALTAPGMIGGSGIEASRLYRLDFDATGTMVTGSGVIDLGTPAFSGDQWLSLGDFAIEEINGEPQIILTTYQSPPAAEPQYMLEGGIWAWKLNDPSAAPVMVNPTQRPVGAIDENGDVVSSGGGNIITIDLVTGEQKVVMAQPIVMGDTAGYRVVVPVPEPSAYLLGAIAAVAGLMTRRRARE